MSHDPTKMREMLTREVILKILNDDEVAAVCMAETADRLLDGEKFVDLDHLERGVQRATQAPMAMGPTLPRKAVHDATWKKIEAAMEEFGIGD
jgi:hypothetical protein